MYTGNASKGNIVYEFRMTNFMKTFPYNYLGNVHCNQIFSLRVIQLASQ